MSGLLCVSVIRDCVPPSLSRNGIFSQPSLAVLCDSMETQQRHNIVVKKPRVRGVLHLRFRSYAKGYREQPSHGYLVRNRLIYSLTLMNSSPTYIFTHNSSTNSEQITNKSHYNVFLANT